MKQLTLDLFPLYNAVMLTAQSRQKLIETFGDGVHERFYGCHITTEFKPDSRPLDEGKDIIIHVIGYAKDNNGEALVAYPEGVTCTNAIPHITLSCAKGVSPVYSNDLLQKGFKFLEKPLILRGILSSVFPKQ